MKQKTVKRLTMALAALVCAASAALADYDIYQWYSPGYAYIWTVQSNTQGGAIYFTASGGTIDMRFTIHVLEI